MSDNNDDWKVFVLEGEEAENFLDYCARLADTDVRVGDVWSYTSNGTEVKVVERHEESDDHFYVEVKGVRFKTPHPRAFFGKNCVLLKRDK